MAGLMRVKAPVAWRGLEHSHRGRILREMGGNCLAERFGRHIELNEHERAALTSIEDGERRFRRGATLRSEQGDGGDIFVVEQGWIFCSVLCEDGRRQIIRLHSRGDLIGLDDLAFAVAPDTITALTDVTVAILDKARLGQMFADHPRLAALLFAVMQVDRVMLTDRLVSLGRGSALGRIAALLLWIAARLRLTDPANDGAITLPLTQEEIGDATGLTAVHVNRTMRALDEQGLIARSGGIVRLLDEARLARTANHVRREEKFDLGWLPPAR